MVTIQLLGLLCITKRPGQTLHSLFHLTRVLLSVQHSWVFFDTERRKTMMTFIGDILFSNVSPHPPSFCQTHPRNTKAWQNSPAVLFSPRWFNATRTHFAFLLLTASWTVPFCHRRPIYHLRFPLDFFFFLSANSLQKINGILSEKSFSLSKLVAWPQLHGSRHREIPYSFGYTDPLWAAAL